MLFAFRLMDARRNTRSGARGGSSRVLGEATDPLRDAPGLVTGEGTYHPGPEPDINPGVADNTEVPVAPIGDTVAQMTVAMVAAFFREKRAQDRRDREENEILRVQRELVRNSRLVFEGRADPLKAEGWLFDMEHQFEFLGVTDTYLMARIAPVMFQGEAVAWWKGQKALMGDAVLDWHEFRGVFLDKYF